MASGVHLIVVDEKPGMFDDAMAYLDQLEQRWSRFIPSSDITRINHSPGVPVVVAPETVVLVTAMEDAHRLTGGRFDPSVLPELLANGYRASIDDPTRTTELPAGLARRGAMALVEIDRDRSTVTVPPGLALDPGGIGKGLAADLLVARLLAAGAAGALVGIGGDLAMGGRPAEDDGWVVTIECPDPADGDLGSFAVDRGGVATSSTRSRRWMLDGWARHHLIDPVTGEQSATDLATVTVVATSGWVAEAHAKAALLAGRAGVLGYLAAHDLTGVAVTHDGILLTTPDLADLADLHRADPAPAPDLAGVS